MRFTIVAVDSYRYPNVYFPDKAEIPMHASIIQFNRSARFHPRLCSAVLVMPYSRISTGGIVPVIAFALSSVHRVIMQRP
jgi:hypothetical protein